MNDEDKNEVGSGEEVDEGGEEAAGLYRQS